MSLRERIQNDMVAAIKAGDTAKRDTLRLAISAFKYKEVETKRPLEDAEVLAGLQTLIKQRKESAEQFKKAGRQDLLDKEQAELLVLEAYLPRQIDDAELARLVDAAIQETGASGPKDMGKVMKAVLAKTGGAAEGSRVSALAKQKLS